MAINVFITGIAGFIGSHLADRFIERGANVAGNDHLRGGSRLNLPLAAEFFEEDCCDTKRMRELLDGTDLLIHCASAAHEGLSVFSPAAITRENMMASVSMFSAAAAAGVRRVVFCSSMSRYGIGEPPFRETQHPAPCDPYGINKVASELVLQNLAETHGFEWTVVIPHNVVGARQRYDDPYRNVAAIMANLMLQGRQPFIYGDGQQRRCFTPISDVAELISSIALDPSADGVRVNIGTDRDDRSILELAQLIADSVGFRNLEPAFLPGRPREVKIATCSADLARERFGFEETTTLENAIESLVDCVRQRGPRPFCNDLTLEIIRDNAPRTWRDRLL